MVNTQKATQVLNTINLKQQFYLKRMLLQKKYAFSVEMQALMNAICQKRTMLHFKQVHFCKSHRKQEDAKHTDECDHLLVHHKPMHFNATIASVRLFDLEEETLADIWKHYNCLLSIIA